MTLTIILLLVALGLTIWSLVKGQLIPLGVAVLLLIVLAFLSGYKL